MLPTMRPLLLVIAVSACAPPEPVDPELCPDAPAAALTDGEDPSVDLEDGQDTMMVHGPQGGWHLLFGVRVTDPSPDVDLRVEAEALGETIVDNRYQFRLDPIDACTASRSDLFGFIVESVLPDGQNPPEALTGEDITLRLTVQSSLGDSEDVVVMTAVRDPVDVE